MKVVSIFDTSVSDYNLGNWIIMDSIYKHLRDIFPDAFFIKLPYMEITSHTKKYILKSNFIFFGGTNSLTGRMEVYRQWGLSISNFYYIRNVILMGVGWWQYQNTISCYTKFLLSNTLSKEYIHSVRDSYTRNKLVALGFENVLNTGCPTLWDLTEEHCASINPYKSDDVLVAFTDYNMNVERDKFLFEIVSKHYRNIYIWLQGLGDFAYIRDNIGILPSKRIIFIPPDINQLAKILQEKQVDYIGIRLHAGIKALQHKRRAIIIGIDNRAIEMAKDFNLPVIPEKDIDKLSKFISSPLQIEINMPWDNIKIWKSQFKT